MAAANNHRVLLTFPWRNADDAPAVGDSTTGRIWLYGRDDRPVSADATVTAPGGGSVPLGPGALVAEWSNVAVNTDYSLNGNAVGSYVSPSLWANVGSVASPADHITVDGRDGSYYVAEVVYRPDGARPRSARFEFQVSASVDYATNGDTVTVGANEVVLVSVLDERIFGTGDVESFVTSVVASSNAGKLDDVVDDTSPQLGGPLDVNGQEITGAIDLHSSGDVVLELGDAAGTNKVSVRDSAGTEQAAVDSDGNITTAGTVDGRDVAADGARLDGIESGWGFWVDGTYLAQATSPFSISASTRTKLENDGTSGLTETGYVGTLPASIWDTTNDCLKPELGKSYDVRLTYKCQTSSGASGNYIQLELDIGAGGIGTGPVIWSQTQPLLKGANTENAMSYAVTVFALAPFPTTGGTFYVTSNVACDIWDIRLLVTAL